MKLNVEVAQRFGFIKVKKNALVDIANIDDYAKNKIVVICTGSRGEASGVKPYCQW